MNKRKFIFGLFMMFGLILTSCENDVLDTSDSIKETSLSRSVSEVTHEKIEFYYKGQFYETVSYACGDSIIEIEDPAIEKLLLELDEKPNLITFSYPDGTYEYFDDSDAFQGEKDRVFALSVEKEKLAKPVFAPREVIDSPNLGENNEYIANLFLHDDRNYEDTMVEFDLKKGEKKIEIPHLKSYGMNDKTSSFCAFTMQNTSNLFELFEDDNYKNHCFSFLVTMSTHVGINSGEKAVVIPHGDYCAPNLKNIHVIGTKRSSWNDRITSIRITQQ